MSRVAVVAPRTLRVLRVRAKVGSVVRAGQPLLEWWGGDEAPLRAPLPGAVAAILAAEGDTLHEGQPAMEIEACGHRTVMRDLCADCGADLADDRQMIAVVPMVHSVPDLKVSPELALKIGREDGERLLRDKKLVLLVDLDQTLIHTTNDHVADNLKDVRHFRLNGAGRWYHTRLRPGTLRFLNSVARSYELHICTFGARAYAHQVAQLLDPDRQLFAHRILSRDECFDAHTKTPNLKALFPCGDDLVCIIDDREDVWNRAANLIQVKPYHFFEHTGDINAPPGLDKTELDARPRDFSPRRETVDDSCTSRPLPILDESKECKSTLADITEDPEQPPADESTLEDIAEDKEPTPADESTLADITEDKEPTLADESTLADITEDKELPPADESKVSPPADESTLADITKDKEQSPAEESKESPPADDSTLADITEDKEPPPADESKPTDVVDEQEHPKKVESSPEQITKEALDSDSSSPTAAVDDASKTAQPDMVDLKENTMDAPMECDNDDPQSKVEDEVFEKNSSQDGGAPEAGTENAFQGTRTRWRLTECGMIDIEDTDDYLLYLEEILKRIHTAFYELYDQMEAGSVPDLKRVIPQVKSQVLAGTSLVFSGLVPTHQKLEHSRAYMVAISLGAEVTQDFTDRTTHLVAVRPGTAKVHACRRVSTSNGGKTPHTVTPAWLWCCAERWQHVEEKLFPLRGNMRQPRRPPPHCGSPPHVPVSQTPPRKRTPSGRFMDTINPLLSFSSDDIANMDKEVEDIINESDESDTEDRLTSGNGNAGEDRLTSDQMGEDTEKDILKDDFRNISSASEDSAESLSGEYPHGWKPENLRKRRRSQTPPSSEDEIKGLSETKDDTVDPTDDDSPSVKFRRGEDLPSDAPDQNDSDTNGSTEPVDDLDDGEWNMMGAALEREFLGLDK